MLRARAGALPRGRALEHGTGIAPPLYVDPVLSEGIGPMLAAQRSLVLSAGHGVPPSWVVAPPPLAFHPEDVPVPTRANAWWFKMMKSTAVAWSTTPAETEVRRALSSLLSRRGLDALNNLPRFREVRDSVDAMLEFVLAHGLKLDAGTDLSRLLVQAMPWYEERQQGADPHRREYNRLQSRSMSEQYFRLPGEDRGRREP